MFTLVPTLWLESVLEKSDTVPQNSPADLTTVKAILKDYVVTKKDFILINNSSFRKTVEPLSPKCENDPS